MRKKKIIIRVLCRGQLLNHHNMNKKIVEGPQFVKKSYPKLAIVRNMNLETSKFNGGMGGGGYF